MAFRLKIDEPIAKGFRRIGVEQIDRARRQLASATDPATEIHEARKAIKRIRALLRLGREGLGDEVFRNENTAFRSIAASLASARDDHVLLQTLAKLAAEEPGNGTEPALDSLKTAILNVRARASDGEDSDDGRTEADAGLEQARRRFRKLKLEPDSFATLERGFVRNYRKAMACGEAAYAVETDDAFHEWRKCVQTFWRHLVLFSRAWPSLFQAHIEATRELSQILGDDHDLALLRQKLAELAGVVSPHDAETIDTLISARQAGLRRAARPRGEIIFAERPKAIGRRIAAVWEGAVKLRHADAHDEAPDAELLRPQEQVEQRG
ncbi:CHAD domain-containing protein [Hyphomicrobium sp. CS1GBMeth3]|uniref:CHAD domain-containing protein n=1 Tax=Hyphomicrobium sp. CS1GBMeth3 TaxID=1892845 RepID=UPI000930F5F5|nr:CHAD domain-containing protein [Hyphomicrobium sp. CS1GBMeth3]